MTNSSTTLKKNQENNSGVVEPGDGVDVQENALDKVELVSAELDFLSKNLPDEHPHLVEFEYDDIIRIIKEDMMDLGGKELLGLRTKSITEFNTHMSGFHGLTILASAPNVGKTSLALQVGIESITDESNNACLVFVSLEMPHKKEVFSRIMSYFSEISEGEIYMGDHNTDGIVHSDTATERIAVGFESIKAISHKIKCMTLEDGEINAYSIIDTVQRLKKASGCSRAMIIIDSLQYIPDESNGSSIEKDDARIEVAKTITATLPDDAVMVISHIRKPQEGREWSGGMADIKGSSSAVYASSRVIVLNTVNQKNIQDIATINGIDIGTKDDVSRFCRIFRERLAAYGISLCYVSLAKGRRFTSKFDALVAFYFKRNQFFSATSQEIGEMMLDIRRTFKLSKELLPKKKSNPKKD